jgi:tRNA-dihydrouridine synthase A
MMNCDLSKINLKMSVAPMMDWTDRHCRYLHRQMTRHALLYTEMVTSPALVRGGALHLLDHHPDEHPVAVQLGGSDPVELAEATRICADTGYDEVNLNVGCPSDRVQSGSFGAVLMEKPDLVADCVAAMIEASAVEVTVKCRIGVDDQDPQTVLPDFLARVSAAGVKRFSIHARKAWLKGLSPKENREVPPLDYDLVYAMRREFPQLHLSINGGISSLDEAQAHLNAGMDGVMIGRSAYHSPTDVLLTADQVIFDDPTAPRSPVQVIEAMVPYIEDHIANGGNLRDVTRHMLGMFAGQPGARQWRRILSEHAKGDSPGVETLMRALSAVSQEKLSA